MARALLALLLLLPTPALAQALSCSVPRQLPRPQIEAPSRQEPKRVLPIGRYTLAISWSPQHCSTIYSAHNAKDAFQCGGRNGRFGFVLHGLWPDGIGKEWPQYCQPAGLLPRKIIAENLCVTPSVQLIQHEWAKHGTCMTTKPELYFGLSRAFFQGLRFPDMAALAKRPSLTVGQFAQAFAAANGRMRADMLRVTTTRGNWLSEVWICLDKQMEMARCPVGAGGAPQAGLLRIEPGPAGLPRAAAAPRPAANAARKPPPPRASGVQPARKPALRLDLDPKVQPLGNSSAP